MTEIPQELKDQGYASVRDAAVKLKTSKYHLNRYIEDTSVGTVVLPNGLVLVKESDVQSFSGWAQENISPKVRGKQQSAGGSITTTPAGTEYKQKPAPTKQIGPFSPEEFSRRYKIPIRDVETMMEAGYLKTTELDGRKVIVYDRKMSEVIGHYKNGELDCDAWRQLRGPRDVEQVPEEEPEDFEEQEEDEEVDSILLDMSSDYGLRNEVVRILTEDPSLEPTLVYLVGHDPGDEEKSAIRNLDSLLSQLRDKGNGYTEDFLQSLKGLKRATSKAVHISLIQRTLKQLQDQLIEDE